MRIMFDCLKKVPLRAVIVLSMSVLLTLQAQEPAGSEPPSFQRSVEAFERGSFREALEGFMALIETGRGGVSLAYYTGRCLVELNEKLPEAIEYLYHAAGKGGPEDSRFYLAEAYRRDYNFQEAIRQYSRFEAEASSQLVRDLKVGRQIRNCRSAINITSEYNPYEVTMVAFMDLDDSLDYSQISMKGGQLQNISRIFPEENGEGLTALAFIPRRPVRGDYFYFVSGSSTDKKGTQMYRSRRGSGRWGNPEEIRSLNTDGDELLPYFDPVGKDLYFASNGKEGVGDFDLYRSHYDSDNKEWSEAINLGFPINSAMDDYLLLPGNDLGMMMFFSNRQGTDSTLTVYRVHMVEPKQKTVAGDNQMLKEIASLGGAAKDVLEEYKALMVVETPEESLASTSIQNKGEKVYTEVKILGEQENKEDSHAPENIVLAEALKFQARSDSLKDLAMAARIRVRESEDPNDRWVWQKQIMLWEKRALEEEEKADYLYAEMGKAVEAEKAAAVNSPEYIKREDAIAPAEVIPGEPGSQPEVVKAEPVKEPEAMNRFMILDQSPYTDTNPVPADVTLPQGVFYRIQIGVFGKQVAPDHFSGISPITSEFLRDRGLVKYYAGKFSRYDDASEALSRVRDMAYEDAFLVAWYNGKSVSTERAKQLE